MGVGVAGLGMPAAVAERIELLDITQPQACLFFHPGAQADLEGAVRHRVERAERKPGGLVAVTGGCGQDQRLVAFDRDNSGGQADFDRRQELLAHGAPLMGISRDRCGTAGLRPSCCPAHFVERAQRPALAPQRLVRRADDQPVRRCDREPRGSAAIEIIACS
jgi:hypothetical protein